MTVRGAYKLKTSAEGCTRILQDVSTDEELSRRRGEVHLRMGNLIRSRKGEEERKLGTEVGAKDDISALSSGYTQPVTGSGKAEKSARA